MKRFTVALAAVVMLAGLNAFAQTKEPASKVEITTETLSNHILPRLEQEAKKRTEAIEREAKARDNYTRQATEAEQRRLQHVGAMSQLNELYRQLGVATGETSSPGNHERARSASTSSSITKR